MIMNKILSSLIIFTALLSPYFADARMLKSDDLLLKSQEVVGCVDKNPRIVHRVWEVYKGCYNA